MKNRMIAAGAVVGITIVALWHRSTVRKERQRAVSEDERRRNDIASSRAA